MNTTPANDWQPIATAPRDGTRILVVIRATEQGPGAVDVARWSRTHYTGERSWIAADSDPACQIVYAESEVLFWMPLPSHAPQQRSAILSSPLPAPPETEGSGI